MSDNITNSAIDSPFLGRSIHAAYFLGIGGIGMSAIARFFHSKGIKVSGYDKTETVLTKQLQEEGIKVFFKEDVEQSPKDVEIIVYTPAIPESHKELVYYRENGYNVLKRSEVLQLITESSFNICIAGTHGKTTISTMVAHLLRDSGYGCNAFLGGIATNYGTNFWSSTNNCSVIEADEYDRSFLKLSPDIAVITAIDADHLDIYGTEEKVEESFIEFSSRVKKGGVLLSKFGLKRSKDFKVENHLTYSLQNESADVHAKNIQIKDGAYSFDILYKGRTIEGYNLNMGGMHNVENAVAAIAVASSLQIDNEKIKNAVASFKGVKRRFEYYIRNNRIVFIDDYAHHPEELKALINGAKNLFAQKKCTIIFQPHLYSRTKDLAEGFAAALDLADEIVLLPIYPARELPMQGVSSEIILNKMKNGGKRIIEKEEIENWVREKYAPSVNKEFGEILITAGAGDIDKIASPVSEILKEI